MDATSSPEFPHQFGVNDTELQPELVPHLIPPLYLQRRRHDNQDFSGPVPDDEFESHHARFDGFSQPNFISNQHSIDRRIQ